MHHLAQFRYSDDFVHLTQVAEHRFDVHAQWRDAKRWVVSVVQPDLDLRSARIEFEKYVREAVCRMTLDRMYGSLGQERPKGPLKYGLLEYTEPEHS